ncbi:MAG: AAA family ATPase [Pseudomonadales bacterium]
MFGRDALLAEVLRALTTANAGCYVFYGATGVGKSALIQELARHLDQSGSKALLFEVTPATQPEQPILELYRSLELESGVTGWRNRFSRLVRHPIKALKRLAPSVMVDLVRKRTKEFERTQEELEKLARNHAYRTAAEIAKSLEANDFGTVIEAIRILSQNCKPRVVLVDNLEMAPEPMLRFLQSAIKQIPSKVSFILSINDESKQVERCSDLMEYIQLHHTDSVYAVRGLTPRDIIDWKRAKTGIEISEQQAAQAFARTDGRPLFLEPWIESHQTDYPHETDPAARLALTYEPRIEALSANGLRLVRALAVCYPHGLSMELLCGATDLDQDGVLDEQRGPARFFIEGRPNEFKVKHELIASYVKSHSGENVTRIFQSRVLSELEADAPIRHDDPTHALVSLKQVLTTSDQGLEGFQFLLDGVDSALRSGAYLHAETLVERAATTTTEASSERKLSLRKARLLSNRGRYAESLQCLETVAPTSESSLFQCEYYYQCGLNYFRLNDYTHAVRAFSAARKAAKRVNATDQELRACVRIVGILSDVGHYSLARGVIANLLERTSQPSSNVSTATRCQVLRWSSRIHAALGQYDVALERAESAVAIADSMMMERNSSEFAKAEVLRQSGQLRLAESLYRNLAKSGRDTGNKDMELYSQIGLALTALELRDSALFDEVLSETKTLVSENHPVESVYVESFDLLRRKANGDSILPREIDALEAAFKSHRRRWALRIVEALRDSRAPSWSQLAAHVRAGSVPL